MIRSNWSIVLAIGIIAALVRAVGPASAADASAMAYLFLATLTFGRARGSLAADRFQAHRLRSRDQF